MVFAIYGCTEDQKSILDDLQDLPAPTISNIDVPVGFGGTEATITGTGFSTDPKMNLITFGPVEGVGYKSVRAEQATSTSLTFIKPGITAVDLTLDTEVRVSRLDDRNQTRSNALEVSFLPLISVYVEGFVRPRGIAFDSEGTCYFSEFDHPDNVRIVKVTETGTEDYAYLPRATYLRGEIEFDSNDNLWVGTHWDNLFKISPGGAVVEETDVSMSFSVQVDANDNVYSSFYDVKRLTPDGTETTVLEYGERLNTCIANGYFYLWERGGDLYKAPITADGLGELELIAEIEEGKYWNSTIVVDTDGNVYGTGGAQNGSPNASNIYKIAPDGTESIVYTLDVEDPWGLEFHGEYLYVSTQWDGRILKLWMLGAVGAEP
jgi:sugar lactone lactonase YvrE